MKRELKLVRFRIKICTTRQISNSNFYNTSDFELKLLQRVRFESEYLFKKHDFEEKSFFKTHDFEEKITFKKHDFEEKTIFKKHNFEK